MTVQSRPGPGFAGEKHNRNGYKKAGKHNRPKKIWLWLALGIFTMLTVLWQLFGSADTWPVYSEPGAGTGQLNVSTIDSLPESGGTGEAAAGQQSAQSSDPAEVSSIDKQNRTLIPVYLVGAVKNPGIYHVTPGIYLYQLVEMAGGLSDNAASESINLAMSVTENGLIDIPTQAEVDINPAIIDLGIAPGETETVKVNINKGDSSALETLPGVGPATAKAIVDYREKNGPFEHLEDLMNIPGIKQSRFESLRDFITLG